MTTMRYDRIAAARAARAGSPCGTARSLTGALGAAASHAARTRSAKIVSRDAIVLIYPGRRTPVPRWGLRRRNAGSLWLP